MTSQAHDRPDADTPHGTDTALHEGAFAFRPDFPRIRHIDDVVAHIRPDEGIRVHRWGEDFIGVNYQVTMPETFQTALDLECRGLVFERHTGALLSRPFHKLFQIGERQSLAALDLAQPYHVECKLDGSMIAAFVRQSSRGGEIVFHTRGGFSRQARQARCAAPRKTLDMIREVYGAGLTPIFEWTSPDNRVVLKYPDARLTLLALRDRETGRYVPRAEVASIAACHGVPMVETYTAAPGDPDALAVLVEEVRALSGKEGVMLVFADGHRVKIKALEYLRHHRIISDIALEKNARAAWLDEAIDDIAAILGDHRGVALEAFGVAMDRVMIAQIARVEDALARASDLDPKARAEMFKRDLPKPLVSMAFAMAKGQDGPDQFRRLIAWGQRSRDNLSALRAAFDLPAWTIGEATGSD